jgi:hypothetical protein
MRIRQHGPEEGVPCVSVQFFYGANAADNRHPRGPNRAGGVRRVDALEEPARAVPC